MLYNFSTRKTYEYEIVFPEERRLNYNSAYVWAIEHFGPPGDSWDLYIVKEYEPTTRYNMHQQRELWLDTFGFDSSENATIFILRWC